ncbi:hypothetical protein CHCC20375_3417 [Bacillus licheniformis]|nr:hypothetical protein CHCC20375_3417 [Bacillus licheniformis]
MIPPSVADQMRAIDFQHAAINHDCHSIIYNAGGNDQSRMIIIT